MATITEVITTTTLISGHQHLKSSFSKEGQISTLGLLGPLLPPPSTVPTEVLGIDKDTPDYHVSRDPRLIRLTGVHPFNAEAPLTDLYKEGFLTSSKLFYVRNHGPVPLVHDEDIPNWELSIEGLVERPVVLNFMQILKDFDQLTIPVTLVCAGNRRKEQNQVRKSKGFSWGAAGVSTALFTGPLMSEVLRRAKPLRKARYVCMEGADKLPNGFYGTSIKLNWVMDFNRGIILAHKMNGEPLQPDHGRPLRAVVPGQIGGRSVKWLKKLIVTESPSDNWYHIYDNRVLPTMVSPDMSSKDPKWWTDERYAIYDLSVNSAAVYPEHGELLSLPSARPNYTTKGYAYGGGGRRITRVEISLDKGENWRLAHIEYPEDIYRNFECDLYGGQFDMHQRETCFCWCLWSLEIPVFDLENSDAILVRAMDEALNIQPRDMYWSVLGMMNNPWYRITITKKDDLLMFDHPTQPALIPGGWMERVKKAGGNLTNGYWGDKIDEQEPSTPQPAEEINMKRKGLDRIIDTEELRQYDMEEKPWFVINGEVYDGTKYLEDHPGGAQSIISVAGKDATEEFLAIHSETAKAMMSRHHIGTLSKAAIDALKGSSREDQDQAPGDVFLETRSWKKAELCDKKSVSWDTKIFTFKLQHNEQVLGLPTGQHLMLRTKGSTAGQSIIRAYTPISETDRRGVMELLVKMYFPSATTKGGKMTMVLDKLPIGSSVEFKGPVGKLKFLGKGRVSLNGKERDVSSFVMICGGSGVTPIFQVLRAIMQDPQDPTTCVVLDGNRTEEDILCRAELDRFVANKDGKCTIVHTLTKAPHNWTGRRGRISEQLIREYAFPSEQCMAMICGPPPMERSVHRILLTLGWKESNLVFC